MDEYQRQLSFKNSAANVTYTRSSDVEPPEVLKCFEAIVVPRPDEFHF